MTIFFHKGLTRNPEIRNTPMLVLPNIWRLKWVRDTKFGRNVSNKMLLNAAVTSFIKGKSTGMMGDKISPPPPPPPLQTQIKIKIYKRKLWECWNHRTYWKLKLLKTCKRFRKICICFWVPSNRCRANECHILQFETRHENSFVWKWAFSNLSWYLFHHFFLFP